MVLAALALVAVIANFGFGYEKATEHYIGKINREVAFSCTAPWKKEPEDSILDRA